MSEAGAFSGPHSACLDSEDRNRTSQGCDGHEMHCVPSAWTGVRHGTGARPCLLSGSGAARGGRQAAVCVLLRLLRPRPPAALCLVLAFSTSSGTSPGDHGVLADPGGKLSSPCGLESSGALGLGGKQSGRGWHSGEKDAGLLWAVRRGCWPEVAAFLRLEITQIIYGALVLTTSYRIS